MRQMHDEISPREWAEWNHDKEVWEAQAAHQVHLKQLELDLARLEAKWSSWLRIPVTIIKLPILLVMSLAYCLSIGFGRELPEDFWRFMR